MEPSKPPSPSPAPSPSQEEQEHTHQESNNFNANPELKINQNNTNDSNNAHAMNNLREVMMKFIQGSTTATLTPAQTLSIDQRVKEYFPDDYHTPDHPPYAAMIHTAIEQLNEEGGSSEEAISDFIKQNNNDLPLAHDTLLKHHLSEFCKRGEIVEFRDKCYLLGDPTSQINPISSPSPSPASSVPASPNLSLTASSISCSSDCSISSSSSDFCLKREKRKRGRPRKRRAEGEKTTVRRNKASVKRRGRPRKKKSVSSEESGSDEQSEEDKIESELYEQEDQANKRGRRKRKACMKSVQGKETLAMVLWEPRRKRGRPRRKLRFEEMQTEATEVEEGKIETADTENHQIEEQNEVTQEQNKGLGKQFVINEQGTDNGNIVEEELLEREKENVVSGNGSKDHEGPKKRRGIPHKSSGRGTEVQTKRQRVPGRKPGRPPKKNVLKQEIKMAIEQIEAIQLQDPNVKEINGVTKKENEPKQDQNQVQGKQYEISEKNLAGEINVVTVINLHEQEDVGGEESQLQCDGQNQRLEEQKESTIKE